MFNLQGKTALVTGATGGIGGAIAHQLHACGATIVASGTRAEKLDTLIGELGERCFAVPANLSDPAAPDALVAAAGEAAGGVDILINNAGLTRDNLAMRMKDEEWQEVLDVNLSSAFRLSRAVLRGMMKARWGRIVTVTSVVGAKGNPGRTNYAASKAGLTGMSKALAQ
ncbi:MAG: SDR family NAD(P)-dependent oxidoreductase, partial [Alphaproteobacteria bacterium]